MRTTPWLVIPLVCLGAACADTERDESGETAGAPPAVVLPATDSADAVRRGEPLATAVAQGLAGRLQQRLAADGAAGAVDFCSTTALELTDSLTAALAPGATVKRTSTRLRNPRNAPDPLEAVALAWFDSVRAESGSLPPHLVQAGHDGEVRYYRPIVIAPFCVQCHGPAERIEPDVMAMLAERYPEDRATGYAEGDFRGLLRVSLPR